MNKRKFLNSKWWKIVISLLATLVTLLIAVFVYNEIVEQKAIDDIMGKVNIDSGDVGYKETPTDTLGEETIKKLSESEFILDKEAKTITFTEALTGGSYCVSTNPDGPQDGDEWIAVDTSDLKKELSTSTLDNEDAEVSKVYVYYMAGVASTMTNFNSSATFYTIASKTELESFASKVNGGTSFSGKTVVLTANISLSSSTSFTPIGNASYPFAGTFNGNGFTISNLYISASSTDYIGLFGYSTGTIKNVTVSGTTIAGNNYVGAIVGKSTGTVDNCKNTNIAITGTTNFVGGIVGETTGTVKNCINSVAITGASKVGGIVGGSESGSITIYNCKNTGNISSSSVGTGGIIGSDTGTGVTVSYCTNSGTIAITGNQDGAGGILGTTGITGEVATTNYDGNIVINNCKNTGTVSCRYSAGGIIGNTSANLSISYCINTSQINAIRCVGGMVGYACNVKIGSSIANCYNSGKIQATQGGIAGMAGMIYGDTGSGYITITNCGNDGVIEGTERSTDDNWYQGYSGIANGNTLKITNCYNNGNVLGYRYVCGIALISDKYTSLDGTTMKIYGSGATGRFYLDNCYNTGSFAVSSSYAAGIATLVQNETSAKNWSNLSSSVVYIGSTYNTVYKASETYDFLLFYSSASNLNNSKNDNLSTYPSVFVSDANYGSATKANYVASWQTTPTILQHPYSVFGTVGSSATVSVEIYGPTTSGVVTYQWYKNTTNSNSGGTAISGATSSSYTTTVQSTDYYYYCQVTSNGTTSTSDAALIGKNTRATNPLTVTAKSLTYTGSAQTLVTTSNAQGTVYYSTSTQLTGANYTSSGSTSASGTNAGSYTVYYYTPGDDTYEEKSGSVSVTISKAAGSVVLSATSGSITYPGTTTFTVTTNKSGGTLSVASSNTSVATASISGTTVTVTAGTTSGTATITVTSAATTNYNSASATYSVSVGSGTLSVTASNYSGTYDGNAHGISVSCSTSGATITYATSASGSYTTTNPTYTNAGTYTTYYQVTKTGYTTVTGSAKVEITRVAGNLSLSATSLTFKYGSSSQQVTVTRTGDGEISATSANKNVATVSLSGTTITVTPKNVGTTTITVSVAEGTNHTAVSGTISISVTDTTPPTVSRDVVRSVVTDFYGWTFEGGAYVDSNGTLVLPDINAMAYSPYISVDYTKWLIEMEFKPLTGNGTIWMGSSYYNASYAQVVSQNGYNGNGWTQTGTLNTNNSASWDGYAGYGSDVKYVRLTIGTHSAYSTGSAEVSMVRITSETSNYAGVKVNVTDDNLDTSSLKYLWSRQSTGITETQITNSFTNGSVINLPFGSQGTYYLWIFAKDTAGNTYLKAVENTVRDTIKIDNPQIEIAESSEAPTSSGKVINVYSINAENKNKRTYIQTVGGGQIEDVASRYVGGKAYKLTKGGEITSENGQWHGIQTTTSALSNLAANTYVIISSDYKTTNPAGLSQFEACGIAKPSWSGYYSVTAMLLNLKINSDGNWHHSSDVFKLNEATQNTDSNIITSGMPNWGYSFETGELYVDGIQWFTIPEANLNDGVAVKKWAVGDYSKEWMRNNGTTYTGNSFTTTSNGTHTVYMQTTSGMEFIRTFEVTGVDTAGPDVSITLNGETSNFGQDPNFASGNNGIGTYNNKSNGTVTITREDYNNAPNTSDKVLHIKTTGEAAPGHGGFYFGNNTSANKIYVSKIVAKIPVGYTINLGSNAIGNGATTQWLTSQAGTGDWKTYVLYIRTGSSGSFSSTNYFYLEGGSTATSSTPIDWYVAYANLYENDLMSWTNQNITLAGNIQDTISGTVAYAFTRSETQPTSWTSVSNTTGVVRPTYIATENGNYYLWAKDAAGNVSMTATYVERIDKEAPVITNIIYEPTEWTNGSVKIYFDATDNLSGVSAYATSNWGYEYCTSYQTITPSTNVSKQQCDEFSYNRSEIYLQIKDQAGNIGQYKMSVSNIDKTAPIFVDGTTHTNQEYNNNAENGTALDSETGFSAVPASYRAGTLTIVSINDGTVNSDKVLKITHPASNTQSGWVRSHYYDTSKVYVRKIYAKIPTGYTLNVTGNGVNGDITWLTSTAGTGSWQEYAYIFLVSDTTTNNMDYGHAFIAGTAPTSSFDWYVATDVTYDATYVFDNTNVTYSGASAILNIEAKDTQSGTNSITVNNIAQTLTTTTTSAKADYTVSSAGTYTIKATDSAGNTNTMTKTAYTITYNANGGTGSMSTDIKIDGANRTLTTNSFTRNGYVFTGWNTQANGDGTSYANGANYSGNVNVTLYAQWVNITIDDIPNYPYTGSEIKPDPVVKYGGTILNKETDYTVSYKNNINAGTATIIVTGTGIFIGTVEKTFKITKVTSSVTVSITGSISIGKTLTATATTVSDGSKSYQWWYSENSNATSGTNISGATGSTYIIGNEAVNKYVGVTVTVAEGTNWESCTGSAITTSLVAGNYRIETDYFQTLEDAYASVTGTSATIIVEQSNTDSTTFTIASGKNITLDLNGKTITKISRSLFNEGTFTITDSSNSNGKIDATLDVLVMNKGTTNVNGGTIEVKGAENSTATCWYVIYSQEAGNVNLNNGTLKIARDGANTSSGARVIYLSNGTATINGGNIIAEGTGAMGIHSYNNLSGKIVVNGGSIKATYYAINCTSGDKINTTTVLVTNGYVEGGHAGIGHNSTGEVKVTGGTIVSDEYGILNSRDSEIIIGDNTAPVSTTTPVIMGAETGIHLVYGKIIFTDGILKGKTSGHRGELTPITNYGVQFGTEVINGETYQTEILALANWSDGKSVYSTLEEAFEKVKSGSTLEALRDITDNSTNAVVNKLITIDLSGKNVSIPNSSITVENGGTIEIIGKSGSTITSGQDTAIINNGGSVTIGSSEGDVSDYPKIEGNKQGVSGNFTINGGTLIGTNNPPYTGTPTIERDYFEIVTKKNGTKYETTIQLEQVPPEITITPSTEGPTNEDVILTIKVTDNFSGVKKATYEIDGKVYDLTLNSSGVGTIKVSENGTYTIYAEDNAGNKSSKTYEVKNIDKTADNVTGASVQDATGEENKVKYATIILEKITTDSVLPSEVVEILISNSSTGVGTGTWIPYETDMKAPWVLDTTDGNGEKTIYIWAKDNAGNVSENPFILKVTLDTKLIGGTKNKIDLSFAGIDKNFDRTELQNYQISYKAGNAVVMVTQTELSKVDEKFTYGDKTGEKFSLTTRNISGAGKLYVVVATKTIYDKAGNVNDVAEIETDYTIDTNAPTITYDASAGNVKIVDTEGNLKAITVDGKAITISNNETYSITSGYIRAYDLAGNVAELSL